jgi:Cu/Ag efflux pump CusA
MLQPLAIAVIGGILISMVLSLLVTPAVYFYLTARTVTSRARHGLPVANGNYFS